MEPLYAGVDLGGTNIKCAIARADGTVEATKSVATRSHEGPGAVLERVAGLAADLCAGARPAALGMAVPGLVDRRAGATKFLPNFPTQWRDVPAVEIVSRRLGCPVFLLNDVRAATLGELTFGRGRTASTMAFFAVGTGIGGGVAVDGKLRLGPLGAAGELGHQTIIPDGPTCGCGNRGCLETLASGPAIAAEGVRLLLSGLAPALHDLVKGDPARVTAKEMAAAARAGDARVEEAIARSARFLGIGIANVVVILHPDLVVIGGGVALLGDLLLEPVRSTVRERVGMFPTDGVAIETSLLGEDAGALGGIALAVKGGLLET